MTDLTTAIHTYLTTAPTSAFHGLAVEMLDHWRGEENLLWRVECAGQEAVVKLYLDAGQARSRRQFDGHDITRHRLKGAGRLPENNQSFAAMSCPATGLPFRPAAADRQRYRVFRTLPRMQWSKAVDAETHR